MTVALTIALLVVVVVASMLHVKLWRVVSGLFWGMVLSALVVLGFLVAHVATIPVVVG